MINSDHLRERIREVGLKAERSANQLWEAMTRGLSSEHADDLAMELMKEINSDDY